MLTLVSKWNTLTPGWFCCPFCLLLQVGDLCHLTVEFSVSVLYLSVTFQDYSVSQNAPYGLTSVSSASRAHSDQGWFCLVNLSVIREILRLDVERYLHIEHQSEERYCCIMLMCHVSVSREWVTLPVSLNHTARYPWLEDEHGLTSSGESNI